MRSSAPKLGVSEFELSSKRNLKGSLVDGGCGKFGARIYRCGGLALGYDVPAAVALTRPIPFCKKERKQATIRSGIRS